ncbi:zinc-ribbon domain-containing protein [bacterium]|nr:zinc-ribbon domain-containing protein [bacterium]MDB4793258.1 zinc-ribbon domain-containing protein [bacterium]
MASPFVVSCSNCAAKLKLKDQSMIGKKVRCPKCSEPFLIQAPKKKKSKPAPADDGGFYDEPEDEWGDDFGSSDDDWDDSFADEPSPRKSKAKSKKSKKSGKKKGRKKKKSKSDIPLGMIIAMIVGGIAFLALIGVGVFYVIPMLGGSPADRMAWLPNDTQTYVEIRVGDIWKSQVLKPFRTSTAGADIAKKMKDEANIEMAEIEKVILGVPANNGQPTVTIHTTKAIDPNQVGPNLTKTTYAGKTVFEHNGENMVSFLSNSKTMVMGPKEAIYAAIDRNGECAVADQFGFLPSSGDVIFGSLSPGNTLKNSPAAMMSQGALDPDKLKTVSGILKLGRDLDLELIVDFVDSEAAQSSLTQAQEGLAKGQEMLEKQQKELEAGNFVINRQQKAIVLKAKDILKSVTIKGSGTEMTTSLSVSGSTIEDIVDMFGEQSGGFMPPIGGGFGNPF